MKLSIIAAALITGVSAELGGVLICQGANATGSCYHEVHPMQTCVDLRPGFVGNTATFAVDGEPFICIPKALPCDGICRSPSGCGLGPVDFDYEHKFGLDAINWHTTIESFWCNPKPEPPPPSSTVDPTPDPTGPSCPPQKKRRARRAATQM